VCDGTGVALLVICDESNNKRSFIKNFAEEFVGLSQTK
jgi:hypothetical protein